MEYQNCIAAMRNTAIDMLIHGASDNSILLYINAMRDYIQSVILSNTRNGNVDIDDDEFDNINNVEYFDEYVIRDCVLYTECKCIAM